MAIDILTPVGRIVGGHPMTAHPVTDSKTGVAKMHKDGITPRMSTYIGLAIPKGAETRWQDTEWGRQIELVAQTDWSRGEYQAPTFAWKISDGDSRVPNKKGKIPAERDGYPGHWVIHSSTELTVPCYHTGHYASHEQIKRKEEIKCGDYGRLYLNVKGNGSSESPGIYVNPTIFDLVRAGIEIINSDGPDAATVFGAVAAVVPVNAQLDPNAAQVPTPAPAPVQPHPDFVANAGAPVPPPAPAPAAPQHVMLPAANGATYEAMIAAGWTDDLLVQHGMMQG